MALVRDNNHSLQEYFPDPPDGGMRSSLTALRTRAGVVF